MMLQGRLTGWMHSITVGQFYTIMINLKEDNAIFFNYFRMSQDTFNC